MRKKSSRVTYEASRDEVKNGRDRYPAPDGVVCALAEHSGKVAQSMLEQPWHMVQRVAMEVIAFAVRLIEEGDPALDLLRVRLGLDVTGPVVRSRPRSKPNKSGARSRASCVLGNMTAICSRPAGSVFKSSRAIRLWGRAASVPTSWHG